MSNTSSKVKNCESCVTKPCQVGCPLNNDITSFIKLVKEKRIEEAFSILTLTTSLPSICGRVCDCEKQCMASCVKGISYRPVEIGKIESFIGDYALKNVLKIKSPKATKYKVAVIGSGPSGLTCASFLRKNGVGVTIYEKHDYLGGLLVHGIPEFRLPKKIVSECIDTIIKQGIKVVCNAEIGKNILLKDLEKEYDAIFLGIGANKSAKLNIEGEDLLGVYGANEFLENNIKLNLKNKKIFVIGGGNTAMDISRVLKKSGAKKVTVVYRSSLENMKANKNEILAAKKDGVKFLFNTTPLKIIGNEKVEEIELIKTTILKRENETIVETIDNSNYFIECDYIITAVGSETDDSLSTLDLTLDKMGKIMTHEGVHTSKENVFAGGDVTPGKQTVAFASRQGRDAAYEIIKYLNEEINE